VLTVIAPHTINDVCKQPIRCSDGAAEALSRGIFGEVPLCIDLILMTSDIE